MPPLKGGTLFCLRHKIIFLQTVYQRCNNVFSCLVNPDFVLNKCRCFRTSTLILYNEGNSQTTNLYCLHNLGQFKNSVRLKKQLNLSTKKPAFKAGWWLRRLDLNQRPSGYHFVPVAVVCRIQRLRRLSFVCSHFGRHRSQKTVHWTVFASLTQRATLAGLITRCTKTIKFKQKKPAFKAG